MVGEPEREGRERPPLVLFVYGSLAGGGGHHAELGPGARLLGPASVRGRVEHLRAGYPRLHLAEGVALLAGTGDRSGDLRRAADFSPPAGDRGCAPRAGERAPRARRALAGGAGAQPAVRGEVYLLPEGAAALERLDRLEGFRPGRRSAYRRVLARLDQGPVAAAWLYAALGS